MVLEDRDMRPVKGTATRAEYNGSSRNIQLDDGVSGEQTVEPARSQPEALTSIGTRLGRLRRDAGCTQMEIARRMQTTQPALARLEKGDSAPNLKTVERYATAVGRDVLVRVQGNGMINGQPVDINGPQTIELKNLIQELAVRRKQQGLTQMQVAKRMETTQPMVARLERFEASPNLRTLQRYAAALEVDLEFVFPKKVGQAEPHVEAREHA